MDQPQVQVRDWRAPADLEPASFEEREPETKTPEPPPLPQVKQQQQGSLLDKLLPLIGKINNGALDITSVLDLLDKSGQGFGALGKLLPILAPILQNFQKKPKEDIVDLKTINLDSD